MNPSSLDVLAAVMTGCVAVALFTIHVLTSAAHAKWVTLPGYVRAGLFPSGAMFMIRSVNLLNISPRAPDGPGHINLEGLILAAILLYTVLAVAYWTWQTRRGLEIDEVVIRPDSVKVVHLRTHR